MTQSSFPGSAAAAGWVKELFLAIIIILLTIAAVQRNSAWQTLLSIWSDSAAKSPYKSRTHNNLGNCHLLLNRYFPAIAEYQQAVALDPENMEAQYNLATTLDKVGLYSPAIQPYAIFCKRGPLEYTEQKRKSCERHRQLSAAANTGNGGSGTR